MAEQVGTLLREWRMARGWSLGSLARQAGVSKSALSQWEAGLRQPRVPELEAALDALGATPAQRVRLFASIEAPRALRHLRAPSLLSAPGPLPSAGDLLKALRLRGGWTQEQIAARLGVGQNTVARWEQGERLPSNERMQSLCFALEAQEDEIVALAMGRFAEAATETPTEPHLILNRVHDLLYNPRGELADLRFLTLERGLWQWAAQDEQAYPLLATAYAEHAHYLSLYGRWEEVRTLTERALALTPPEEPTPHYTLRAILKRAAAEVYGGRRLMPERGLRLLKAWLPRSSDPNFTAWILSDMARYLTLLGQMESALELAKKAVSATEAEREFRQIDHSSLLLAVGRPGEALERLPDQPETNEENFVYEALVRVEAHLMLDERSAAHDFLQRAYAVIEANGLMRQRAQADALAKRL